MEGFTANKARLSDRILFALELALKQQDLETAEILTRALEMSMTRNAGGGEFVERREYPQSVDSILQQLRALRSSRNKT